jgi:hypothetical protein
MSTKKTIQINPELFKMPGNKTRKSREKKELTLNPIVSPNNLKNKLLNRIKEHKSKETKGGTKMTNTNTNTNTNNSYTDEFYGALDYLSNLSKKQKTNEVKQRLLNTRTLKNHQPLMTTNVNQHISLDLPPELQEPIKSSSFIPQSNEVFNVNYKVADDVPYGCLKGGQKKTYREWKELSKPDIPDIVRPPTPPKKNEGNFFTSLQSGTVPIEEPKKKEILSREERLEQIKNKLRQIQDKETNVKQDALDNFKNLEKTFSAPGLKPLEELNEFDSSEPQNIENMIKEREDKKENEKTKKYLKKTVKRKFTLGRSDKLRRVSVLIKDRQTRKNVISMQKELKKTNITDVRKYLRQHGMIKVGSTCPTDILRKMFEAAVLTGEVTNTNKDMLLHNFMTGVDDEKQEN